MAQLTLYSREGCHLCEVAETALSRVRARVEFELQIVDVDTEERLQKLYGMEVPVLLVDGEKFSIYEVDEAALAARLGSDA